MRTITTTEVERDRWGRPLIKPAGGGKSVPYTRCTTFVDALEDKYNLQKWMQRQVAIGLSERDDLRLAVAAHRGDKREMDRICEQALEAAKSSGKATVGTALHALTEQIDRGSEPSHVPAEYQADLAAYRAATAGWKHEHIETLTVQDTYKVAGTPDRVVKIGSKRYIADLKTGASVEFGSLKIAMQLAMYSRSKLYDIDTGERTNHDADVSRGIVIHLPAGTGQVNLYWIDLLEGWNSVGLARDVRQKRAIKLKDITEPFAADAPAPKLAHPLPQQIDNATTPEAIRELWAAHKDEWNDALTKMAQERIARMPKPA